MNTAIFVLIVVFTSYKGGAGIVSQEFSSFENCEKAGVEVIKANSQDVTVRAQGCFKK